MDKEDLLFEGIIKIGSHELELKRLSLDRLSGILTKMSEKDDEYSMMVCDAIESEIERRKSSGSGLYLHPKEMVERWVRQHETVSAIGDTLTCPVCEKSFIKTHHSQVFCSNSTGKKSNTVDCKGKFWAKVHQDRHLPYTKAVFDRKSLEDA